MASTQPDPGLEQWLAPLLTPAELAASDRHAIEAGTSGIVLMERAGAALSETALSVLPPGRIVVLCGPGNNGGDGLIAAELLARAGREVTVAATRDPAGYRGDAALARDRCTVAIEAFSAELLDGAAGAIDALLGTGATGPPRGAENDAIQALTATGLPVVACDLPSGVDAAGGTVPGPAVDAVCTVTFHRPSPGHLVHPAKGHVGRLVVADIGLPARVPGVDARCGAIRDAAVRALPGRSALSHKYSAGAVLVAAGSDSYPSAALLSVRGAQRAGAGYVTAYVPQPAGALIHARTPEVIVRPWSGGDDALGALLESRADAVVLGPGLGPGPRAAELWRRFQSAGAPLVVDADALVAAVDSPTDFRRDGPLVLTPHAGELGRLLGRTSAQISTSRLTAARDAAQLTGAVVVLKGDDTIVAAPDGRTAVNDLAAPALATAGTGDVLAGAIGALLARGAGAWHAAVAGVRLHARAGAVATTRSGAVDGVVAWDVAEALPAASAACG